MKHDLCTPTRSCYHGTSQCQTGHVFGTCARCGKRYAGVTEECLGPGVAVQDGDPPADGPVFEAVLVGTVIR